MLNLKSLWSLIRDSVSQWSEDFAPSMGAAIAYYTIFSIAPLLVIAIAVAGFFFGNEAAQGEIFGQLRGLIGERGADTIRAAVASASQTGHGTFAAIVGIVVLLLGATTVFGELQSALNRIWDSPKAKRAGIRGIVRGKLLSFGMVLGVGFLLLVSLMLSAALSALGKFWSGWFPGWDIVLQIVNFVVSLVIITGLFAMIYKLLPSADIGWADVWVGAGVTSLLFAIGKSLIGLYLGRSSIASSFGAAGSLVIVLIWVYYSAQVFLLGAEFTRSYSYRHGSRKGQAKPAKANAPTREGPATGTKPAQPQSGCEAPKKPQATHAPAATMSPSLANEKPPLARLRLATGIAATLGLAAGEFLNEWRRTRGAPRRRWWRA